MKKTIKYIDSWFLTAVGAPVLWYVHRSKFSKHKYDFNLIIREVEIFYSIAIYSILIEQALKNHQISDFILDMIVMIAFVILFGLNFWISLQQKEIYDEIFSHRKNPLVYKTVKDRLKKGFRFNAKFRLTWMCLSLILGIMAIGGKVYLVIPLILFLVFKLYIDWIFDFDEPEKKERREKDTLTELMAARFRDLVRSLKPRPI